MIKASILGIFFVGFSCVTGNAEVVKFNAMIDEKDEIGICNTNGRCAEPEGVLFHDFPANTVTISFGFAEGESYYLVQNERIVSDIAEYREKPLFNIESLIEKAALLLLGALVSLGSAVLTLAASEKRTKQKHLRVLWAIIEGWTGDKSKLYDALSDADVSGGSLRLIRRSTQETIRKFDQGEENRAQTIAQLKKDVRIAI